MEQGMIGHMKEAFGIQKPDLRTYSPLALAYIGDSVYEMVVRTLIVSSGNAPVKKYHKRASAIVNAHAQAAMAAALDPFLTEEERTVCHRGKNAKPATMAKNATAKEYKAATGFEALLGYLYLTDQYGRLVDLVKKGFDLLGGP